MKKIMGLLTILVLSVALVGCSGSKSTTTCNVEDSGFAMSVTLDASGDKITKQESAVTMDTETYKLVASEFDALKAITGVTVDSKESGTNTILTITIDYKKADMNALVDAGIVGALDSNKKVKFVSLEETVKSLEGQGATCTKK